jgi:ergothioneine biosynthesis protein EgtB
MRFEVGHHCEGASALARPRDLADRYRRVRAFSEELSRPLAVEDHVIQSMPDASPTKWHLAHTSWFFETFVLSAVDPGYRSPDPLYGYLFNSYYEAAGERHCRPRRGLLSRPSVEEIRDYRRHVDRHLLALLDRAVDGEAPEWASTVELGLHHEQQHQELILTDIKHAFHANPMRPVYAPGASPLTPDPLPAGERGLRWISYPAALREIGHDGSGFAFDNESPRHPEYVGAFVLASRPVSNRGWLAFMADGGYARAPLWLSEGWKTAGAHGWEAPLYWERKDGEWWTTTLSGMRAVDLEEPVCHVSYYEADAYAQWAGARLPTEAAPGVRRRVGMDAQRLSPVPGLSSPGRCARRVQRQVHVRADGAAGRLVRDVARAHPQDLPELLSPRRPLAVLGRASGQIAVSSSPGRSRPDAGARAPSGSPTAPA